MAVTDKIVIITGCHRSGTSLTAYICSELGVQLGNNLLVGPKFSNPDGHFEDLDLLNIHDKVLLENHMLWHNIDKAFHIDRYNDLLRSLDKHNYWYVLYEQKIKKYNTIDTCFGYKDPRLSVFLDIVVDKIRREKRYDNIINTPVILLCWRNPHSIAHSLIKRDHFTLPKALSVAAQYQFILSTVIVPHLIRHNIPTLHIQFEQLVRRPDKIVPVIQSFLYKYIPQLAHPKQLLEHRLQKAINIVRVREL